MSLVSQSVTLSFDQQTRLLSSRFGEVRLPSSWLQPGNVKASVDNWRRIVGSNIVVDREAGERVSIKVYGLQTGDTGLVHLRRLHASDELLAVSEIEEENFGLRRGRLKDGFFYGACRKQERSLFCIEMTYGLESQKKIDQLIPEIVSTLRVY